MSISFGLRGGIDFEVTPFFVSPLGERHLLASLCRIRETRIRSSSFALLVSKLTTFHAPSIAGLFFFSRHHRRLAR